MKSWIIRKLGGFANLDDAISFIKNEQDESKKNEILTEAVKKLFNTIDADDILRFKNGDHYFKGVPMNKAQYQALLEEVEAFKTFKFWEIIKTDVKYQLNKKMFEDANVELDLVWGKLITWLFDCVKTRIEKM